MAFLLDRLGTTFEVKSVEQRIISGHAAAWALDRVGDVIDKKAFTRTLAEKAPSDVAVFIGHKADELPVGVPLRIEPDAHGLFTEVRVFDGPAGDNLLAVAKGLKAAGQTLGLSIGYRVRDARMERTAGKAVRVLTDIDLIEFSYAARQTVANPAALMTDVKRMAGWSGKPYAVRRRGGKWLVVNSETGDVRGEHDTERAAHRQMRALYVHVPDARGKAGSGMYGVRKKGDAWVVTKDGEPIGDPFDSEDAAKAAADKLTDGAGKTVYPNALPDSAFLYVQPGGVLDDEGKTVPRSHRHFRYRDAAGEIDGEALADVLGVLPQVKITGLDADDLARIGTTARRLYDAVTRGDAPDDEAPEWKSGAAVDLLTVAYGLIDAAEQVAAEQQHRKALGEDTKAGWRMGPESAAAVKALSGQLARLVEHLDLVAAGRDEEALADWWRAQFELMGVTA